MQKSGQIKAGVRTRRWVVLAAGMLTALRIAAHGDVTPQAVDTRGLPALGDAWADSNPFSGHALAIKIGTSAFNQNCAQIGRAHV